MRKQKLTAQRCGCSIFPNNGSERTAKRYPTLRQQTQRNHGPVSAVRKPKRRPALLFENLFTLFRCSHHRKILCYVRMETARVPTRAVFTLHKMFAAETACQAHAVIYLPIPSAAPFYGIDAAKQQREERNRSSLCCLPHFFRSAFCSALRCFFAIRSAFFCSFATCHSFFC